MPDNKKSYPLQYGTCMNARDSARYLVYVLLAPADDRARFRRGTVVDRAGTACGGSDDRRQEQTNVPGDVLLLLLDGGRGHRLRT